jgi:hypothetical protein
MAGNSSRCRSKQSQTGRKGQVRCGTRRRPGSLRAPVPPGRTAAGSRSPPPAGPPHSAASRATPDAPHCVRYRRRGPAHRPAVARLPLPPTAVGHPRGNWQGRRSVRLRLERHSGSSYAIMFAECVASVLRGRAAGSPSITALPAMLPGRAGAPGTLPAASRASVGLNTWSADEASIGRARTGQRHVARDLRGQVEVDREAAAGSGWVRGAARPLWPARARVRRERAAGAVFGRARAG